MMSYNKTDKNKLKLYLQQYTNLKESYIVGVYAALSGLHL